MDLDDYVRLVLFVIYLSIFAFPVIYLFIAYMCNEPEPDAILFLDTSYDLSQLDTPLARKAHEQSRG